MSLSVRRFARVAGDFSPVPVLGVASEVGFNVNITNEDAADPIVPWGQFTSDIDRLVSTGATWVRVSFAMWMTGGWWQTEGNQLGNWYPNVDNWNAIRDRLKYAHARGLKIVLTTTAAFRDWDDIAGKPLNTFDNMVTHNAQALGKLAEYWGPWVSVWGILNEFDQQNYRTLQRYDAASAATIPAGYWNELGQVITACSRAIKAVAPHILTTYSAWGFPANDARWQYWRDLYDSIGTDLDIFGVNAYTDYYDPSYPTGNTTITNLTNCIATTQAATIKPIFITETGFPGYFGVATNKIADGEKKAADTIPHIMPLFQQAHVPVTIMYKLRDDGNVADVADSGEPYFGIYYHDGSPKPYRDAVAAVCTPIIHRATIPSGASVFLSAGAGEYMQVFSWRIVSGGGSLLSTTSAVTRYVAPSVSSDTTIIVAIRCGLNGVTSAEKLVHFIVKPL